MRDISSRLEIRLEGVDRYLERRIGIRAPQFATLENHRIEPLWIIAEIGRDRIREHVATVAKLDYSDLSASIARQSRVCLGMDIPCMYAIADLEFGRRLLLAEKRTSRQPVLHYRGREFALQRLAGSERMCVR